MGSNSGKWRRLTFCPRSIVAQFIQDIPDREVPPAMYSNPKKIPEKNEAQYWNVHIAHASTLLVDSKSCNRTRQKPARNAKTMRLITNRSTFMGFFLEMVIYLKSNLISPCGESLSLFSHMSICRLPTDNSLPTRCFDKCPYLLLIL